MSCWRGTLDDAIMFDLDWNLIFGIYGPLERLKIYDVQTKETRKINKSA